LITAFQSLKFCLLPGRGREGGRGGGGGEEEEDSVADSNNKKKTKCYSELFCIHFLALHSDSGQYFARNRLLRWTVKASQSLKATRNDVVKRIRGPNKIRCRDSSSSAVSDKQPLGSICKTVTNI
jgi:hypothetical protein